MTRRYVPIAATTALLVLSALLPGTQVLYSIGGGLSPRPVHVDVMAVYNGPGPGVQALRGFILLLFSGVV
jgi:hypothetical protein